MFKTSRKPPLLQVFCLWWWEFILVGVDWWGTWLNRGDVLSVCFFTVLLLFQKCSWSPGPRGQRQELKLTHTPQRSASGSLLCTVLKHSTPEIVSTLGTPTYTWVCYAVESVPRGNAILKEEPLGCLYIHFNEGSHVDKRKQQMVLSGVVCFLCFEVWSNICTVCPVSQWWCCVPVQISRLPADQEGSVSWPPPVQDIRCCHVGCLHTSRQAPRSSSTPPLSSLFAVWKKG